mgnify:CR=1 FL=1
MKFTEAELLAIQFPRSEHYGLSATYSAALTMGNCAKIHTQIDARRRVDGTVTAADVEAVFLAAKVQLDERALGEVNFAEIAYDYLNNELNSMWLDGLSVAHQLLDRHEKERGHRTALPRRT